MTAATPYIAALRRFRVPMLPTEVADYDELKQVLELLDGEIGSGGGGSGGSLVLDITKAPYSADKTGVSDCSTALSTALADGYRHIWFPAGTYKFTSPVSIPVNTTLIGESMQGVIINATGSVWVNGEYTVGGDGKPNWARIHVVNFTIKMAQGGISLIGHECRLHNLLFRGGAAGHWCIKMRASNECAITNCSGGYDTNSANFLNANGIKWYATSDESTINYGDGLIQECAFKGQVDDWIGISLVHEGTDATKGVINNITVERVQCQAPGSGSDPLANPYDSGSVRVKSGSIGVRLDCVQRCTFIGVDTEASFYGFYATGQTTGLGGRSTKRNVFVGCQGFSTRYGWYEYDEGNGRSGQNTFIGNQEMQPLLPVAFSNGDPNGTYLGKASPTDAFVPNGLWFARPGNGSPKVQIRGTDGEQLYICHLYQEPSRDGTTLYPYDSAPKYKTPRKALGIDVSSSLNAARIYRPQGFVSQNSLSGTTDDGTAPGAEAKESRIIIGNGYGFTVDGAPVNPLHRVEIADPLYIVEWSNPLVTTYGGLTPGIVANARYESVIGNNERWRGPGLYSNVRVPGASSFEWVPLFNPDGWILCQMGRSGSSYTVDRGWFGKLVEHTAATNIVIPADLIHADEATGVSGRTPGRQFLIKSGVNNVTLTPGSGVTMYVAGSTSSVSSWVLGPTAKFALVIYQRTGSGTARVDIVPLEGSGSGSLTLSHSEVVLDDSGELTASNATLSVSGTTLTETVCKAQRGSSPSSSMTISINSSAPAVGRRWFIRAGATQTGAIGINPPSGGLINGRSSIGLLPARGKIQIECVDATAGATRFEAVGDIVLPNITASTTWDTNDIGVERVITGSGAVVTIPTSFSGEASVFSTVTATLRINGSTDIGLSNGDVCFFRGDGTTTRAYRSNPTMS